MAYDFWSGVLAVTVVGVVWTIVVLLVLDVGVSLPWVPRACAWLFAMSGPEVPACGQCGRPARVLGHTKDARWFYCADCGRHWRDDQTVSTAVAS